MSLWWTVHIQTTTNGNYQRSISSYYPHLFQRDWVGGSLAWVQANSILEENEVSCSITAMTIQLENPNGWRVPGQGPGWRVNNRVACLWANITGTQLVSQLTVHSLVFVFSKPCSTEMEMWRFKVGKCAMMVSEITQLAKVLAAKTHSLSLSLSTQWNKPSSDIHVFAVACVELLPKLNKYKNEFECSLHWKHTHSHENDNVLRKTCKQCVPAYTLMKWIYSVSSFLFWCEVRWQHHVCSK